MKILVTGGAGFIGSHIVDGLVSEGHEVVILDDFSAGNREFVNPESKVIEADIRDADAVNKAFAEHKPEAVFHLAAMIELRKSMEDPEGSRAINVDGSRNIISASRQNGVKKIIFSSSAAVYGDNQNLPIKETEPIKPASPYGEQKSQTEIDLQESGIPSVILRYSNVYGPRQGTVGEGGVVAIFCKKLLHGESPTIFGGGTQTRDFVDVVDVAAANIKALSLNKSFAICNIATGAETSVNKVAELLLSFSGKSIKIAHAEPVSREVLRSSLDNGFAKKTLNWEPVTGIEQGLEATWKWFNEQSRK